MVSEEGLTSVYKGVTAAWLRECIYSTLRLGLYEPFKKMLGATDPKNTPFYLKFFAGGMSGFVGAAMSNPTDIVKIRMQACEGEAKSLIWHANDIYTNWGLKGFYKAVGSTCGRAVLLNGTKLSTYDHFKHLLINNHILKDGNLCHFVSCVGAGICIACVTGPVDTIRTRLMN